MKQLSVLGVSSLAILMGVTACQKPAEKPADTAATSSATTAASADMPQIRIATESSFVPFSYKDANGKLIGFEIDLADALCAEAKLKSEVISQDSDGPIPR